MKDEPLNDSIKEAKDKLKAYENVLKSRFEDKKKKIVSGDDLPPGVQQVIKVYLSIKRRIRSLDFRPSLFHCPHNRNAASKTSCREKIVHSSLSRRNKHDASGSSLIDCKIGDNNIIYA